MNNINKEEKMTYDIDCLNITRRAYEEYIKNKTNPDNTITEKEIYMFIYYKKYIQNKCGCEYLMVKPLFTISQEQSECALLQRRYAKDGVDVLGNIRHMSKLDASDNYIRIIAKKGNAVSSDIISVTSLIEDILKSENIKIKSIDSIHLNQRCIYDTWVDGDIKTLSLLTGDQLFNECLNHNCKKCSYGQTESNITMIPCWAKFNKYIDNTCSKCSYTKTERETFCYMMDVTRLK